MTNRTYTYTAQDYADVFGDTQIGVVGVDPDGDLVWSRRADIVWAYDSIVLNWLQLSDWRARGPDTVVYAPSAAQRAEFEAR